MMGKEEKNKYCIVTSIPFSTSAWKETKESNMDYMKHKKKIFKKITPVTF
jgi:hypothetical protein